MHHLEQLLKNEDLSKSFTVGWYDLDFNHHLNNVFYLQWILETVPDELLQNAVLDQIDIIYKMECQWKEEVACKTQILAENHLLHQLILTFFILFIVIEYMFYNR